MTSIDANKALVRRWFTALDLSQSDAVDMFLSADYVDHNPAIPNLPAGRDGVREANRLLYAAFSKVTHTIADQLAEGDKVMTRVVVRGQFTGEFLGFPPTGQVVQISGVAVHRIVDGQFVEHWAHVDMADFMRQVGAPSPLPADPGREPGAP